MHRMVLATSLLLFGLLPRQSAAENANVNANVDMNDLPTNAFADENETLASIKQKPLIIGDPETQRRTWIIKAFELRDSKAKMDQAARWAQIDEYMRAADHIRSSTFTRCNLAMLAHHQGDHVRAAEYFRLEQAHPLPKDASDDRKFTRHLCDTMAALAYQRVGELNIEAPDHSVVWINHEYVGSAPLLASVFVKPNEEQNVLIELTDKTELRRTVKVKAGRSTTLEFQSTEKPVAEEAKEKEAPKPPPPLPLPRVEPEDATWKYVAVASGTLFVSGVVLSGIGTAKLAAGQDEYESATADDSQVCTDLIGKKECRSILLEHRSATALNYAGLGLLGGAVVTGIIAYVLKPTQPTSPVSVALSPNSITVHGTF